MYGSYSKKNIEKLYSDLKLHSCQDMKDKINAMWDFIGEDMDPEIQKFYRFYTGRPPYDSVKESLLLLSKILREFYDKKVIVLVDEHDAPLQKLYTQISLNKTEDNTELMKSINIYTETITEVLGKV
jgi:hypothetical protein